MQVRFLEAAQRELDEAIEYYSAQVPFLGQAFLIEVLASLERVKQYPEAWPHYRRILGVVSLNAFLMV